MLEVDLLLARSRWIDESISVAQRKEREASDFLKYVDSAGKFADFHGLRHTFVTNLCRAGVSPQTAQSLARHSGQKSLL
jgi:site-specific recombinase XerD